MPPPRCPPPPPAGGAGAAAASGVHVPEKSGFCANATLDSASTAAAMIPVFASFIFCSLMMIERIATQQAGPEARPTSLFKPQRFDWIEASGLTRWIEPEKDPRCRREPE